MCQISKKLVEELNLDEKIDERIDNMILLSANTIYADEIEKSKKISPEIAERINERIQYEDEKHIIEAVGKKVEEISKCDLQTGIQEYVRLVDALKNFYCIQTEEDKKEEIRLEINKPKVKKLGVHPSFKPIVNNN